MRVLFSLLCCPLGSFRHLVWRTITDWSVEHSIDLQLAAVSIAVKLLRNRSQMHLSSPLLSSLSPLSKLSERNACSWPAPSCAGCCRRAPASARQSSAWRSRPTGLSPTSSPSPPSCELLQTSSQKREFPALIGCLLWFKLSLFCPDQVKYTAQFHGTTPLKFIPVEEKSCLMRSTLYCAFRQGLPVQSGVKGFVTGNSENPNWLKVTRAQELSKDAQVLGCGTFRFFVLSVCRNCAIKAYGFQLEHNL